MSDKTDQQDWVAVGRYGDESFRDAVDLLRAAHGDDAVAVERGEDDETANTMASSNAGKTVRAPHFFRGAPREDGTWPKNRHGGLKWLLGLFDDHPVVTGQPGTDADAEPEQPDAKPEPAKPEEPATKPEEPAEPAKPAEPLFRVTVHGYDPDEHASITERIVREGGDWFPVTLLPRILEWTGGIKPTAPYFFTGETPAAGRQWPARRRGGLKWFSQWLVAKGWENAPSGLANATAEELRDKLKECRAENSELRHKNKYHLEQIAGYATDVQTRDAEIAGLKRQSDAEMVRHRAESSWIEAACEVKSDAASRIARAVALIDAAMATPELGILEGDAVRLRDDLRSAAHRLSDIQRPPTVRNAGVVPECASVDWTVGHARGTVEALNSPPTPKHSPDRASWIQGYRARVTGRPNNFTTAASNAYRAGWDDADADMKTRPIMGGAAGDRE